MMLERNEVFSPAYALAPTVYVDSRRARPVAPRTRVYVVFAIVREAEVPFIVRATRQVLHRTRAVFSRVVDAVS